MRSLKGCDRICLFIIESFDFFFFSFSFVSMGSHVGRGYSFPSGLVFFCFDSLHCVPFIFLFIVELTLLFEEGDGMREEGVLIPVLSVPMAHRKSRAKQIE